MANYGAMAAGAQQGAQMGMQFGPWGAAIGAGVGGLLGLSSSNAAEKALKHYNDQVVKNAATALFDTRRVQNAQNRQMSQALLDYQMGKETAQATYNAAYGAADMIGGSADALAQTLSYQTQQAQAEAWNNFDTSVDNNNRNIDHIVNQYSSQLKRQIEGQSQGLDFGALAKLGASKLSKFQATKSIEGGGLSKYWDMGNYTQLGGTQSTGALLG